MLGKNNYFECDYNKKHFLLNQLIIRNNDYKITENNNFMMKIIISYCIN